MFARPLSPEPRTAFPRVGPVLPIAALAGLVAGVLPPLYGLVLVLGGAVVLASLISPVFGLAALALAIPFSPAEGSGSFNLPIAPSDGLLVVILGTALAALLSRRVRTIRLTRAFGPGVAFLTVLFLSASLAPDPVTSAKELLRWAALVGALVVAATFCVRWAERRLVLAALFAALIGEALLGWAQFLLRRGPDAFRIGPFLRAYGTFGQPNPYAGYLAMLVPLAAAVVVAERPWARRPTWFAAMALAAGGLGGAALLMSLSRGALVGLIVGLALLFAMNVRRGGVVLLVAACGVVVVLGLHALNLVPAVVATRLDQIVEYVGWYDVSEVVATPQNWAIIERMAHWQAAWNMYLAHPLLGVGPGHYPLAYPDYRVNDFWKDPLGHAHDIYLNIMAEEGFLGILGYAVMWASWVGVLVASYRRAGTRLDRALASGVLAGLLAVAVHNVFDNLTVHGLGTQMGLLIGLAAAVPSAGVATARPEGRRE